MVVVMKLPGPYQDVREGVVSPVLEERDVVLTQVERTPSKIIHQALKVDIVGVD
jgi:hypothetical protein